MNTKSDSTEAEARPLIYGIRGKIPYPVFDPEDIPKKNGPTHVGDTTINGVRISTVFLRIEHGILDGRPILFETLVFGGYLDQEGSRYCTWDEAELGHEKWCEEVRKSQRLWYRIKRAIMAGFRVFRDGKGG